MSQETVQQLRVWLTEQGLDAFLVTQPQNRSYLSGWMNDDTEGAGMLLVGQEKQVLLTNPLYQEVAGREATGWEVVVPPPREYAPSMAAIAREAGWKKVGFESSALTYAEYAQFREAFDKAVELV